MNNYLLHHLDMFLNDNEKYFYSIISFNSKNKDTKLEVIQYYIKKYSNEKLFLYLCEYGFLNSAKKFKTSFPDINYKIINDCAFRYSCKYGHKVAQWLKYDDWAFFCCCANGHLKMAQWLKASFPDINHRLDNDCAFCWTCLNGHFKVAQWLKSTFPDINHRASYDCAFRWSCEYGHLKVAQWLKASFPDINHRARDDYAFRFSNNEIKEWLKTIEPELL